MKKVLALLYFIIGSLVGAYGFGVCSRKLKHNLEKDEKHPLAIIFAIVVVILAWPYFVANWILDGIYYK